MPASREIVTRKDTEYVVLRDSGSVVLAVYRVRKTDGRLVRLRRINSF